MQQTHTTTSQQNCSSLKLENWGAGLLSLIPSLLNFSFLPPRVIPKGVVYATKPGNPTCYSTNILLAGKRNVTFTNHLGGKNGC